MGKAQFSAAGHAQIGQWNIVDFWIWNLRIAGVHLEWGIREVSAYRSVMTDGGTLTFGRDLNPKFSETPENGAPNFLLQLYFGGFKQLELIWHNRVFNSGASESEKMDKQQVYKIFSTD